MRDFCYPGPETKKAVENFHLDDRKTNLKLIYAMVQV